MVTSEMILRHLRTNVNPAESNQQFDFSRKHSDPELQVFPIKNMETFNTVETKLNSNPMFRSKMVCIIYSPFSVYVATIYK